MGYWVEAAITPKAAAKLLISSEIDVLSNWNVNTARKVLDELMELSIDEILSIIDCNCYGDVADIKYIPQFGKIETIAKVTCYFVAQGQCCADYPQMGFYLKQDVNATLVANTKFGENHGKAAAILGIAACVDKRIVPSALTEAFCSLEEKAQDEILSRLMFRVPIVQIILKAASKQKVNGYVPMEQLKESTRHRRGQSVRAILKTLNRYQNDELDKRLRNVVWEET